MHSRTSALSVSFLVVSSGKAYCQMFPSILPYSGFIGSIIVASLIREIEFKVPRMMKIVGEFHPYPEAM